MFQYKTLNNILYLNKQLLIFNKKDIELVLTVDYKMKKLITFLLNVNLLSNYRVI